MRIAVLADIHGNQLAFAAALADVRRHGVDQIVIAGDIVVGSPDSADCWELARSLTCPIIRGNHERYVVDYATPRADPAWDTPQFAPLQYAAAQLGSSARAAAAALPSALRLPDAPDLLIVHASQRSDHDTLRAHTPDSALPDLFPDPGARLIARGHNHIAGIRPWGRHQIVTVGSVGLPLDGVATAQYALLDRRDGGWTVSHRSVPYDLDAALGRFYSTGYIAQAGVIARLYYRELASASFHIVPFLRCYQRWQADGPLDLEAAFERFCRL
jgi:predicted phosphodiesterase